MKKKILSLVLVVAFALSLGSAAFAATFERTNDYADARFSDVSTADWFFESVKTAYEFGLVKGSSATSFTPKGNITVAETIVLAARLHNIYNGGNGEFIQGSPWYKVYVDYALENGIITNAYRDYGVKISRANFAFILANALPSDALTAINKIENGELTDVKDDYKSSAIYTLYRAGVLTGNDEFGTFNPDSTITRAEVSAIITRMADSSQRKSFSLKKKGMVSADIYRGAIGYANSTFLQNYGISLSDYLGQDIGYGMNGAEFLKEQAFSMITEFEAARLYAIEKGAKLTDADKESIENAKNMEYSRYGGREAFLASLKASNLNEAFYDYLLECQIYYSKAAEIFSKNEENEIDAEGIAKTLSESYVRVKHILIQADPSGSDYKEKETLAKNILQKISRGEDFEKLLAEYGEDPGMITNPDGYMIDKNGYTPDGSQMVSEFAIASNALKTGEVSEIVKTAYGFHIIKRYPINKAITDSFIAENMQSFKENAFMNVLSQYVGKVTISNRAELEAISVESVFQGVN